ncbi:hypothetical protein BGZ49_007363 [Haplosporangium sp. Z 27]|nr:hypothetical protein BGZ49_007363 [Haplosporangium sp. Z 27]
MRPSSFTRNKNIAITTMPAITIACIALLSASTITPQLITTTDAAPASKGPINPLNTLTISADSPLSLQLQIEAQAAGKMKLAYLPTTGPSLDFYYLNYRPSYIAGESKIDFWMLTPEGGQAPKTASLELYDELGKIHLAVLVPEGTEIPKKLAEKNEPFLWQSWQIPKNIKSDFDFSEKFRVVLKTSDSKTVVTKRAIDGSDDAVVIAQDRQFKIKGLQAIPGGRPNPAKTHVNSVATSAASADNIDDNNEATSTNTDRPPAIAGGVFSPDTNTNIYKPIAAAGGVPTNTNIYKPIAAAGGVPTNINTGKPIAVAGGVPTNINTGKPITAAGGVYSPYGNANTNSIYSNNKNIPIISSTASSVIASRIAVPLMIVVATTFASLC